MKDFPVVNTLTYVPVRCSCQPQKLLGFIGLTDDELQRPWIMFPGYLPAVSNVIRHMGGRVTPALQEHEISSITLSLHTFRNELGGSRWVQERAFKAEGLTAEHLRQIPQFIEVKS